ncbi:hypothetical protein QYE76_011356 [Lolium multiflorum]|uniref:GATA-type domain-containing protein n=1 Tax=Lolium multiflorum TaxID=4521 RepID=A0AAD8TYZ4_LOLMU|nr:hypothetical protein QYE76_011356 [Lolium multiflorum]
MVVVDELHGDAATVDLLASAGDLQSFFDHLGLEVAAAGGDDTAEEELEWLSNKEAFPTVDTMELEPAFVGPRRRRWADEELERLQNKDAFLEVEMPEKEPAVKKAVRRLRRAEEGLDGLPNKDAVPEAGMVDPEPAVPKLVRRRRRRRRRKDEELDWRPNKDALLEVETEELETAVMKMVLRRRRAGAPIAHTAPELGQRRRRADEDLEWMLKKDAFLEVETAEPHTAVTKLVLRRRRVGASITTMAAERGQRRQSAHEKLEWSPKKDAFRELGTEEEEPDTAVNVMKMVLRRRRAGASIASAAAEPGQRRQRADEDLEWMPNKDAFQEVETEKTQPAAKKVARRRLRRRAKKELEWLPNKKAFLEVETAEPEPALTKMVLRRRRAGASIALTAPKPRERRCSQCGRRKTPHWRAGPEGPRTLCNACGRRYRSERLVPEYRPFTGAISRRAQELYSSMPRRIVEMCRAQGSATFVDVMVPSASPTHHLSKSPPRTKEAVCKQPGKPFLGDLQASSDHAGLEVAAGGGGEEQLDWPSNEDALQVLVTMEPEPSVVEPRVKEVMRQRRREAEPGHQWCQHCGARKKPHSRVGLAEEEDEERHWLPNKNFPAMKTMEMKPPSVLYDGDAAMAREGPSGPSTLCNACGVRYRNGGLVPEYRPLSSPTFSPELHSNKRRCVVKNSRCALPGSSPAAPLLTPPHK